MPGVLQWPGLRSEYAWLPAHEQPTRTGAGQVGIAFSGHHGLPWSSGGRTVAGDIAPGSTIVTGSEGITWLRVREPTEALEMYPAAELLRSLAGRPVPELPTVVGAADGTVLAVGAVLRRAHATGDHLGDVAASTLAHLLAAHLLRRYAGVPVPRVPATGPLDARTVDRVAQYVDSALDGPIGLDRLAAVARLSPFHFARAFRSATGLTPHAFVTARRMDRARQLLRTGPDPVDEVARAVGYRNLSHFRRVFRQHTAVLPSAVRN